METAVDTEVRATKAHKAWWLSQPSVAFARDRNFYFKYDLTWAFIFLSIISVLHAVGWQGIGLTWTSPWAIPAFLFAAYVQVLSGVCVHNATHGNFPKAINRLAGEVLGVIIGTRYATWEVLHKRHHTYSDHREKDPHPNELSFWYFFITKMLLGLEGNIRMQHFERFGESKAALRRDYARTGFSFLTNLTMLGFWYSVLGMVGFFYVFLPSLLVGALHVSHFNWATHNGENAEGIEDFRPTNLNTGIYKLGNMICFGLYMHANHHAFPTYFDPRNLPEEKAARVEKRLDAMARQATA